MPINRNFFPRICASFIFSHSRIIRKNYRKSFDILITHLTKAGRPKTLEHERIFGGGESSLMITFLKREAKRALLESTGIHSSITLISSIRCRGPATRNRRKQKEGKIERERGAEGVYSRPRRWGRVRVWSGIACVFSEVFNPRAGSVSVALARQICDLANGPRRLKRASRHNFLD